MLILTLIRALVSSRASLALENVALRQQVTVLKRSVPRPRLRRTDRLLWVFLRRVWSSRHPQGTCIPRKPLDSLGRSVANENHARSCGVPGG